MADGAAAVGGAILPLALSPFGFWVAAPISVALLYYSVADYRQPGSSTLRVVVRFYLYNLGMFGFGASWIYVSIHEFGNASPPLAASLVLLTVCGWSLVAIPQGFLYARYLRSGPWVSLVGFVALWVLQEWFRGWFLTGFPWLFVGYALIDTPLAGYGPAVGVFGMSFILVLVTCLVFHALFRVVRYRRVVLLFAAGLLILSGFILNGIRFTERQASLSVSLVQGNIDQRTKWLASSVIPVFDRYMGLTGDEWGRDLIVWPEAALTLFKDRAGKLLEPINALATRHGSTILLGIPDVEADMRKSGADTAAYQNTVIALGRGDPAASYVKRRLVPFGEFVPFENQLRGVIDLLNLPMSRNRPGPPDQAPLMAGDLRLSVSICYEVAFPDLVRTTVHLPDLLVTVSNDTWFGDSIGPWQHLQMARMRALENGRSLVRSTNNGITAVINHRGQLVATLPRFEQGVLRSRVDIHHGETPFHRFGHLPVLSLCLAGLLLALMQPLMQPGGLFR